MFIFKIVYSKNQLFQYKKLNIILIYYLKIKNILILHNYYFKLIIIIFKILFTIISINIDINNLSYHI